MGPDGQDSLESCPSGPVAMQGPPLDSSSLREIETITTDLVRQAGRMALERFRLPIPVEYKRQNRSDPVTEADRSVEAYLRTSIEREFPDHAILGEEGTEVDLEQRDFLWALDPVDGTTNFVAGLPLFATSAGLLWRGMPVVGAIFLPVAPQAAEPCGPNGEVAGRPAANLEIRGAVVHARLGGGAFLNGDQVAASEAPMPDPSRLAGLPGHHARQFRRRDTLRANPGEPRALGSVCYETAMVACGIFQYAVFRRPQLWDVAAGSLIVREAGGEALLWDGRRWRRLERFEPVPDLKRPEQRTLRFWRGTVLVGGKSVAGYVAGRLRPGMGAGDRLATAVARLLGLGRSGKGAPPEPQHAGCVNEGVRDDRSPERAGG